MSRRFVSLWFDHLKTDWFSIRQPDLKKNAFVLRTSVHGRMVISATNAVAEMNGIHQDMVLADARAIMPGLEVKDDIPLLPEKLLKKLAEWCIRFSPFVSVNLPDGLIIDASGCTHLWGGDEVYLKNILSRLQQRGYSVKAAIADTVGAAWGFARYGNGAAIVPPGMQVQALHELPVDALRIDATIRDRLYQLGLRKIRNIVSIPYKALRRRFGQTLIERLAQAHGLIEEILEPVIIPEAYEERLPCLEPIMTRTGVEIALRKLLEQHCARLIREQKGLRDACFTTYRLDGQSGKISISTTRPSHKLDHLYRLFEDKLQQVEVEPGIELFTLSSVIVEDHLSTQEKFWESAGGLDDMRLSELIDKISIRQGGHTVQRYLPDEHHLPEKSLKPAASLLEEAWTDWKTAPLRPMHLLSPPELIEVTAPIPDYPPMMFRYKGRIHKIIKADGPERIEQEWWIQRGRHRDYYIVEDEEGKRYWLFRSGHYDPMKTYKWYIHGFFA